MDLSEVDVESFKAYVVADVKANNDTKILDLREEENLMRWYKVLETLLEDSDDKIGAMNLELLRTENEPGYWSDAYKEEMTAKINRVRLFRSRTNARIYEVNRLFGNTRPDNMVPYHKYQDLLNMLQKLRKNVVPIEEHQNILKECKELRKQNRILEHRLSQTQKANDGLWRYNNYLKVMAGTKKEGAI